MCQHSWCYLRNTRVKNIVEKNPFERSTTCVYASSYTGHVETLACHKPNVVVCFIHSFYINAVHI